MVGYGCNPSPQIRRMSRQPLVKFFLKSTFWNDWRVQDKPESSHDLYNNGTIRSSYRASLRAYRSSCFTHLDLTELLESTRQNQSQRASALPISSCHCCAPTILVELNQIGTPWWRRTPANLFAKTRSLSECERKTSVGKDCCVGANGLAPIPRALVPRLCAC